MDAREIAEQGLIFKATVGSEMHGINVAGTDDHDEMGLCIEPPEYVIGLKHFEQWVYREQAVGERSKPGDTEGVIYSLRKYVSLALKGNPTILCLMYIPNDLAIITSWVSDELFSIRSIFASKQAGKAFLGYMQAQRMRLEGLRGGMRVHRPELVDTYGYDTKYAAHIIRLGMQGVEYLETGNLTLPMSAENVTTIKSIRRGELHLQELLTLAGELEKRLKLAIDSSPLPDEPDYGRANEFLIRSYNEFWRMNERPS